MWLYNVTGSSVLQPGAPTGGDADLGEARPADRRGTAVGEESFTAGSGGPEALQIRAEPAGIRTRPATRPTPALSGCPLVQSAGWIGIAGGLLAACPDWQGAPVDTMNGLILATNRD
jgi:hypothetical protein